jgi:hypothetical protein
MNLTRIIIFRYLISIVVALSFVLAVGDGTQSRSWRETPLAAAQDYLWIQDQRPVTELMNIFWNSPVLLPGNPRDAFAEKVLTDNLFVAIGQIDTTVVDQPKFITPEDVLLVVGGNPQPPNELTDIDPIIDEFLDTIKNVYSGVLGPSGKHAKRFIFSGSGISSCEPGGFAISYAGENYTYKTPIPGC